MVYENRGNDEKREKRSKKQEDNRIMLHDRQSIETVYPLVGWCEFPTHNYMEDSIEYLMQHTKL